MRLLRAAAGLIVAFSFTACEKENVTAPAVPQPAAQIDTFTTSGKEYIFSDLTWDDDELSDFHLTWNTVNVFSAQLFYDPKKWIEVSILPPGSTGWIKLPKDNGGAILNYYIDRNTLHVTNSYQGQPNNLYGAKVSVKVRFF